MRKTFDCSIYFIADPAACGARSIVPVVEKALEGGVTMVQYRDKKSAPELRMQNARAVLKLCRAAGVPLLINDHVKLAHEIGADGVHIGQGDSAPEKARAALGDDAIIGLTAFTEQHLDDVDPHIVDYVGTGPVYETKTDKGKPVIDPIGLAWLREFSPVPMVGIGGITPERAAEVILSGADGVAVMRAIGVAENPDQVVRSFRRIIEKARAA